MLGGDSQHRAPAPDLDVVRVGADRQDAVQGAERELEHRAMLDD
jgi:hypothetical protein